jgi:hypothetical protein
MSPFYRRTTGIVIGFIFTNCGGILSTWMYPATEAPRYKTGTSVLLAMSLVICLFAALNMIQLFFTNKSRARRIAHGETDEAEGAQLGDRSVHFKMIL